VAKRVFESAAIEANVVQHLVVERPESPHGPANLDLQQDFVHPAPDQTGRRSPRG